MPTVKLTSGGKVILKNGKVSCECCTPTGCCMYPAQGLEDEDYTEDDLPDAVTVFESGTPINLSRVGRLFGPAAGTVYRWRVIFTSNVEGTGFPQWLVQHDLLSNPDDGQGWQNTGGTSECLFGVGDGNLTPADDPVEDQFAAEYRITGPEGLDVIVTRISLCVWEGGGYSLQYATLENKWAVTSGEVEININAVKTDNQSSPVGGYDDIFWPEVEVSEI